MSGRIAVLALSDRGEFIAREIREGLAQPTFGSGESLPGAGEIVSRRWRPDGPGLGDLVARSWKESTALVMVMAVGIAVRTIAPLLNDKRTDPAIVVVDEGARFAVSLAGGHLGGANRLAEMIGNILGAVPVVTTASESLGFSALDLWAREQGLEPEDPAALRRVSAGMVRGEEIVAVNLWPEREAVAFGEEDGVPKGAIVITDRSLDYLEGNQALARLLQNGLVLRPKTVFAGIGCRRGATLEAIEEALHAALRKARISERSLACFATIDRKSDEPAILAAADRWSVPVSFYRAEELEAVRPPNPSSFVREEVGAWGVAEPAAMLAGGTEDLLLEKTVAGPVTVALARGPWPSLDWAPGMRPV